jgi:hypothetical protein
MYEILPQSQDDVLGVRASDTLTEADYDRLVPFLEARVREHGPLRVLVLMEDWHGWDSLGALWEDAKMDAHLNEHIERIAMVGDEEWERWMTKLSKPFADGRLRYFDAADLDEAWAWVREGASTPAT